MFSAGIVSAIFLVGYLAHKVLKGMAAGAGEAVHTQFGGDGAIRVVYYVMLITHVILAISIAYLVPRTFAFAFQGDFETPQNAGPALCSRSGSTSPSPACSSTSSSIAGGPRPADEVGGIP